MLGKTQERLERSIFEKIRLLCVAEGYTPDITNTTRYPQPGGNFSITAQSNWETDLATINSTKGFAIEIFNNSQTKSTKAVPRIVIMTRRATPGDVGAPMDGIMLASLTDPDKFEKMSLPFEASHYQFDIHVVYKSDAQERTLNAIIGKAIGMKRFLNYYDDPNDRFLMVQYNHFDYPDPPDELGEKAYSYQVPDVFDYDGSFTSIAKINEITAEVTLAKPNENLSDADTIVGKVIINSSSKTYE